MIRSSALSLALGYVALGLTALVLFAAPLWYAWQVTIQDGRAEILQADAQRLTDIYKRDGAEAVKTFIDTRVKMQIAGERILLLTDSAMHPLAGNLHAWPATVPQTPGNYTIQVNVGKRGDQQALVHVAMLGDYNLLVGRDNALFQPLQTRFWYGLSAAVAVLCIAGLLVGIITRRALMSRVHSIRQTVSAIMHGDLKHRLPTHLSDDELNTLSRTINGMLDQIELLVHGVRNVSNSIAHDLRTPLAELRSRLEELSLIRPSTDETYAEIDGAVADVDRVIRIFDALLRLAEIDAGMRRSGFVSLDVSDLAANAVEFYEPAAELKDIDLKMRSNGPLLVSADPVLLAQALEQPDRQCAQVRAGAWFNRGRRSKARRSARGDLRLGQRTRHRGCGKNQGDAAFLSRRRQPRHAGRRSRAEPGSGGGKTARQHAGTARQRPGIARRDDGADRTCECVAAGSRTAEFAAERGGRTPDPGLFAVGNPGRFA